VLISFRKAKSRLNAEKPSVFSVFKKLNHFIHGNCWALIEVLANLSSLGVRDHLNAMAIFSGCYVNGHFPLSPEVATGPE
jgi:hypothetical protein